MKPKRRRRPDHLDVVVDDRDVDAAGQQRLAGDLAEAAEADDQRRAAEAVGDLDAVQRRRFLAEQELRATSGASGVSAIDMITAAVRSAGGLGVEDADAAAAA